MGVLSQRVHNKLDSPQWRTLRDLFLRVSEVILGISPEAHGELAGSYVKFAINSQVTSPAYAVVWPKVSAPKQLLVGLSLPEDFVAEPLGLPPDKLVYKGLTRFLTIDDDQTIPDELQEWAKRAYDEAMSVSE
jgi:hypothetical protein